MKRMTFFPIQTMISYFFATEILKWRLLKGKGEGLLTLGNELGQTAELLVCLHVSLFVHIKTSRGLCDY